MAPQEGPEHEPSAAKPDAETKAPIEEVRAEAKAAHHRAKAEERARLKAEKALAQTQEALAATRVKLEAERLERAKAEQARAEAERALAEARKATEAKAGTAGLPPTALGAGEAEQRVSFIVRLTVDERGQPRRTEVEHAQSSKKEVFPGLDVQRLAAFMEACISPLVIPEATAPPAPSQVTKETPTPELPRGAARLTISDVRIFRTGPIGLGTLVLRQGEAFVVHVHFQLHGPDIASLTAPGSSFEVRVYAREVTKGTSALLTTYGANLVENVLEYTVQMQVSELSPGLYRLVTLVTLDAPLRMAGHHDGPIVHVFENQPSANPAPLLHGPLPQ